MIPLSVDVPMRRLPWANWGLILATVVLSLAVPYSRDTVVIFPAGPHSREDGDSLLFTAQIRTELSPLVLQRAHFAPYQVVTSLFQHAGLTHLFGNMLFLFVFGNAINAKLGHLGFLASYLGLGALENFVWLVVGLGDACVGASAAIMGLCGMFFVLYPRNDVRIFWDELELSVLTRTWTAEVPGWVVVLLYLAFDVWGALFDRNSGIGYVSHVVGALLGLALAVTLLKGGWLTPDLGEQTLLQWLAGEGPVEEDVPRRRPGSQTRRRLRQ